MSIFFVLFFSSIWAFELCCYFSFVIFLNFQICHNLGSCILSQFVFLSFGAIWVFKFCHNFIFEHCHILIFFPIWFYEFHHKSSLWVSYNLGFVTILFWRWHIFNFWVLSQFEFFRFHNLSFSSVTIWISEFCHDLSFLLVQLRILSFVKIWVVEFCHSLNYCF